MRKLPPMPKLPRNVDDTIAVNEAFSRYVNVMKRKGVTEETISEIRRNVRMPDDHGGNGNGNGHK